MMDRPGHRGFRQGILAADVDPMLSRRTA